MDNVLHYFLLINLAFAALCMLASYNPVHSVLFLILVFLCAASILLFLGAEFVAIIFIIVYVGAIAVLFLFIVMMLNIKLNETEYSLSDNIPFVIALGVVSITQLYFAFDELTTIGFIDMEEEEIFPLPLSYLIDSISNTEMIGQVLYQEFILCFLLCGVLLLIAMLGAIVLTQNFSSKKTNEITTKQLSRGDSVFFLFRK
jgi:NADH-quinone oxidoreductase subunit J